MARTEHGNPLRRAARAIGNRYLNLALEIAGPATEGLTPEEQEQFVLATLGLLVGTQRAALSAAPQLPLTEPLLKRMLLVTDDLNKLALGAYPEEEVEGLAPQLDAFRKQFVPSSKPRG